MKSWLDKSNTSQREKFPLERLKAECQHIQSCINQTITVNPANSWDEHLENLVPIQHLYWIRNTFSITSIANNHALPMRVKKSKVYKVVIFRTLFSYVSLNQSLESIFFYYSEQFLADVTPYFLRAVQFSLSCYVGLCSLLLSDLEA